MGRPGPETNRQELEYQESDYREPNYQEPDSAETQPILYTCPSCGPQIVTDETTAVASCYYCHNPVILAGRLERQFRSDCAIPSQIDRQKAEEISSQQIERKRYVSKAFHNKKQIGSMNGVHSFYWLYNCRVDGELDTQRTRLRT